MSDALFLIALFSAFALHIVAWRQFVKTAAAQAQWRRTSTLLGLLMYLTAFAFPWIYAFSMSLQNVLLWDHVVIGCWALCALAVVAGAFGVRQARLPLVLGSIVTAVFWTMIPIGIL